MNRIRLKEAEKKFMDRYPGGFTHPEMQELARKHKSEKMIALALEAFAEEHFTRPEQIAENMVKIVSASSMVSLFEKPKFRDYVRSMNSDDQCSLTEGLHEFLYLDEPKGFKMMSETLRKGKLAKWTLMTICPVHFRPLKDVYVKPTTAKGIIQYFGIENLVYRPAPTWEFYSRYRDVINTMREQVDSTLAPDNAAFSGFLMMSMNEGW